MNVSISIKCQQQQERMIHSVLAPIPFKQLLLSLLPPNLLIRSTYPEQLIARIIFDWKMIEKKKSHSNVPPLPLLCFVLLLSDQAYFIEGKMHSPKSEVVYPGITGIAKGGLRGLELPDKSFPSQDPYWKMQERKNVKQLHI